MLSVARDRSEAGVGLQDRPFHYFKPMDHYVHGCIKECLGRVQDGVSTDI